MRTERCSADAQSAQTVYRIRKARRCAVGLDEITISLDTDGGKIGAVSSMSLYNMNTGRPANKLILCAGKATTGTNEYGAEAIVSYDGRVVEFYSYYGNHKIPDGCFALSGHGIAADWIIDNCRVGSYIKVDILGKVTAYASKADCDAASGTLKVAAGSRFMPARARKERRGL